MEQKLICAMLSNIQNVNLSHGNFWLKTKDDYIKVIKSQKYIVEKVETKKGNFFSNPIYREECKYLQEWTYELIFKDYKFNIEKAVYDEIKTKRSEYLSNQVNEELDELCKPIKK